MGCEASKLNLSTTADLLPSDVSKFELSPVIDVGRRHCLVYVAKINGDERFSLKIYSKHLVLKNKENTKYLLQELKILSILRHRSQFICNVIKAFQDSHYCYLLTELCIGSSLHYNLKVMGRYNEAQAAFIVSQLFLALDSCHAMNILHRNVTPKSILITGDGYVKLSGFDRAVLREDINVDALEIEVRSRECIYLAPEIFSAHTYGICSDLFSVGAILFEIVTHNNEETKYFPHPNRVIDLTCFESFPYISNECKCFIERLLYPNPRRRLGALGGLEEIKSHTWLRSFDWTSLETKTLSSPLPIDTNYFKADLTRPELQEIIERHGAKIDLSEADQALFCSYSLNEINYCQALERRRQIDEKKSEASRHHHRRRRMNDKVNEKDSDGLRWTHAYDVKSSCKPYSLANDPSCIGSPTGVDPLCGYLSSYYLHTHERRGDGEYRDEEEERAINEKKGIPTMTERILERKKIEKLSIDIPRVDDDEYLALRAAVPMVPRGRVRSKLIRPFTPPVESEPNERDAFDYRSELPYQHSQQALSMSPLSEEESDKSTASTGLCSLRLSDETKMVEYLKSKPKYEKECNPNDNDNI